MSYQAFEKSIISKTYAWRNKALAPFLGFLARRKVTANHITYFRALIFVVGVMYPLFVRGDIFLAFLVYLIGFWGLDSLDGALARYTNSASDRGRFIDIFVDILAYSILILGLAYLGAASVFVFFYHVIVHGGLYVISAIYKNEDKKSDWIIRAEPNLIYLKFIPTFFIGLYAIFDLNLLNIVYAAVNAWMTILLFYYFIKFEQGPPLNKTEA